MAENQIPQENKMGTMPVHKLLINMSLPLIISMLVQACYNIVDSIFVSRLCEDALTSVSLAFPVQNLMIAFATGTGVGINALLSRRLGEQKPEEASKVANVGMLLSVITSLLFALLGGFFSRLYFTSQTDIAPIINYGTDYLSVVTIFSMGLFVEITYERILQGTGRSLLTMYTQGLGAIINIILDPILIFGLLGFPAMGVKGAALATVIGQIIAALFSMYLNHKLNTDVHLSIRKMKPDWKLIGDIYAIGFPSVVMVAIGSIMNYLMNQILLAFNSTAAAVFGVYYKLNSFAFMPLFGLTNGLVPIIGYNYGANNRERILKSIKLAMIYGTAIMTIGWALFEFIPGALLSLFDASETMLAIGIPAFKITSWAFLLAGISIVASSVFQALGKSMYSLLVSFGRQLVVLVPVAYLLSLTGNLDLVWLSFPIAELACILLSAIFLRKVLHVLDPFKKTELPE